MSDQSVFTPNRLERLIKAFTIVCQRSGIEAQSPEGREIATRILTKFSGLEPEADIVREFSH